MTYASITGKFEKTSSNLRVGRFLGDEGFPTWYDAIIGPNFIIRALLSGLLLVIKPRPY
ncbi:hypothetical protein HRbin02_00992 [Candidatus Calditenuaceae archaeon HR02]|nr:hypothetical protein HRbin02_00992 [Candidatus Calditenuaceae archaeon HR02]